MNGRLGSVKPREIARKMKRAGFTVDHQTGSHTIMLNSRRGIQLMRLAELGDTCSYAE